MLALIVSLMMTSFEPSVLSIPREFLVVASDPTEVRKTEWIEKLHECENNGNRVPKKLDTNGKYSYGYVHFQMGTWLSFGKPFGATEDNILDDELQKKVARSMLDKGLWEHWYYCGKSINAKLGEYPTT